MDDEVRLWLEKAEEDWLSAEWLLLEESPVTTPGVFHLQQVVEKLLKAILVYERIPFERRHDLRYLAELTQDPATLRHRDLFDELTPYAVETRYPGDAPVLSKGDARDLLGRVGALREDLLPTFQK